MTDESFFSFVAKTCHGPQQLSVVSEAVSTVAQGVGRKHCLHRHHRTCWRFSESGSSGMLS